MTYTAPGAELTPPGSAPVYSIRTRRGLGDFLVVLPAAYALASAGYRVNLVSAGPIQWAEHLPLMVSLGSRLEGSAHDLNDNYWFDWQAPYALVESIAETLEVELGEIPLTPYLERPPALSGYEGGYVAVIMEGSCQFRHLSAQQIAAVAACRRAVVLHDKPREVPAGENLTGQTSIGEFCALVAHAEAVVACDGGGLHLAAAMNTPLVAVTTRSTCHPQALARSWQPSLWLEHRTPAEIPGRIVAEALELVIETRPEPPVKRTTGEAWWQSAAVRSRLAQAALHQQEIDRRCNDFSSAARAAMPD